MPRPGTAPASPPTPAPAGQQRLVDAVAIAARGSGFQALSLLLPDGTVVTWPPTALPDSAVAAAPGREATRTRSVLVRTLRPGEQAALGIDPAIQGFVSLPLETPTGAAITAWCSEPPTGRTLRQAESTAMLLEGPARRLQPAPATERTHPPEFAAPDPRPAAGTCGSLAHELNNVVTAMLLDAELLTGVVDPEGPAARSLARLVESSERAAHLGTLLRMASGQDSGAWDPVDLGQLGEAIASAVSREDGTPIHFRTGPGPLRVYGDRSQLSIAIHALLRNATEASLDGVAPVELAVDAIQLLPDAAHALGLERGGRHVRVTVVDSGVGMSTDTLLRCTRPFYSTDRSRLGLGLAATEGLARAMGGALVIDSAEAQGTIVELWLPAAA